MLTLIFRVTITVLQDPSMRMSEVIHSREKLPPPRFKTDAHADQDSVAIGGWEVVDETKDAK